MEADREQVLERALPFREGEEVYLEIIEPHMYSAGDAVAKVDGYIISVKGADDSVGYKRLVRIEEVGRTEAKAILIDQPPIKIEEPKPKPKPEPAKPAARRRRTAVKPAAVALEVQDEPVMRDDAEELEDAAAEVAAEEVAAAAEATEDREAEAPKPPSTRSRSRSRRATKAVQESPEEAAAEPAVQADSETAANVGEAETADESAGNDADGVESAVRRRGRRGGRRRSTAKAGSAPSADESSSE
jgi:ribonuclease G